MSKYVTKGTVPEALLREFDADVVRYYSDNSDESGKPSVKIDSLAMFAASWVVRARANYFTAAVKETSAATDKDFANGVLGDVCRMAFVESPTGKYTLLKPKPIVSPEMVPDEIKGETRIAADERISPAGVIRRLLEMLNSDFALMTMPAQDKYAAYRAALKESFDLSEYAREMAGYWREVLTSGLVFWCGTSAFLQDDLYVRCGETFAPDADTAKALLAYAKANLDAPTDSKKKQLKELAAEYGAGILDEVSAYVNADSVQNDCIGNYVTICYNPMYGVCATLHYYLPKEKRYLRHVLMFYQPYLNKSLRLSQIHNEAVWAIRADLSKQSGPKYANCGQNGVLCPMFWSCVEGAKAAGGKGPACKKFYSWCGGRSLPHICVTGIVYTLMNWQMMKELRAMTLNPEWFEDFLAHKLLMDNKQLAGEKKAVLVEFTHPDIVNYNPDLTVDWASVRKEKLEDAYE